MQSGFVLGDVVAQVGVSFGHVEVEVIEVINSVISKDDGQSDDKHLETYAPPRVGQLTAR